MTCYDSVLHDIMTLYLLPFYLLHHKASLPVYPQNRKWNV